MQLTEENHRLIGHLTEKYFVISRDYTKGLIGGAIAFILAVGVVSWGAAKGALETAVAKKATDEIHALRTAAERDSQEIAAIKSRLPNAVSYDVPVSLVTDAFGSQDYLNIHPPERFAKANSEKPVPTRWIIRAASTQQ